MGRELYIANNTKKEYVYYGHVTSGMRRPCIDFVFLHNFISLIYNHWTAEDDVEVVTDPEWPRQFVVLKDTMGEETRMPDDGLTSSEWTKYFTLAFKFIDVDEEFEIY